MNWKKEFKKNPLSSFFMVVIVFLTFLNLFSQKIKNFFIILMIIAFIVLFWLKANNKMRW